MHIIDYDDEKNGEIVVPMVLNIHSNLDDAVFSPTSLSSNAVVDDDRSNKTQAITLIPVSSEYSHHHHNHHHHWPNDDKASEYMPTTMTTTLSIVVNSDAATTNYNSAAGLITIADFIGKAFNDE